MLIPKIESRKTLVESFFILVILLIAIAPVSIEAFYGVVDYDIAKAINSVRATDSFWNFNAELRFIQGIAFQIYGLHQLGLYNSETVRLIELGCFLLSCYLILIPVRHFSFTRKLIFALALCIITYSPLLVSLSSKAVFLYAESLLIGSILLYIVIEAERNKQFIQRKHLVGICVFIALATIVDFRFSYYLFIAAIVCSFYIGDKKLTIHRVKISALFGLMSLPFVLSGFYLRPNFTSFKPAHAEQYFYSGEFFSINALSFLEKGAFSFLETLTMDFPFSIAIFVLSFIAGVSHCLKKSKFVKPLVFLVIALTGQALASLFSLYPFGSVRYSLFCVPFFAFYASFGVSLLFKKSTLGKRYVTKSILLGALILPIFGSSYHLIPKLEIMREKKINYDNIMSSLIADNPVVYCDVVTQVILKAERITCDNRLLSSWQVTRNIPENENFYSEFFTDVENAKVFAMVTYRPMHDVYYKDMNTQLKSLGFVRTKLIRSGSRFNYNIYSRPEVVTK